MVEQKEEAPRLLRLAVKIWGAFSAVCCASFGFFMLFTFTAKCLAMGIYMVCLGCFVLTLEAPIFCQHVTWLMKVAEVIDRRFKFWMRAGMYLVLSVFPVITCLKPTSFLGCGAVLITAALYGVLAIGKKGGATPPEKGEDIEMKANLVDNKGNPNMETVEEGI